MIVVFGDIHFSDEREWSLLAGRSFISYLDKCPDNNEENIGVFLGDITEKASVSPLVYELLFDFLHALKFKRTYILRGNHDKKRKRDKWVTPLYFLQAKNSPYKNVSFIDEASLIEEEDTPLIFLPYRSFNEAPNMQVYESALNPEWYHKEDALVFGHFADTSSGVIRDQVNIERFRGTPILGHIHNPVSEHYIGSVMPNAISEKGIERHYRIYDKGNWTEKSLPNFLDYYDVIFPEDLPQVPEECIPVYTIHNCQSQAAAYSRYPEAFIRKCIYDNLVDVDSFSDIISTSEVSFMKTIHTWLDAQDTIDPSIKEKVLGYLHATN